MNSPLLPALCGLTVALLLPACTTLPAPDYPVQHPANPDALHTPAPAVSSALDGYRPSRAGKAPSGPSVDPAQENYHDHR